VSYLSAIDFLRLTIIYRFLYFLFLSVDACFRLKRRNVSNEAKDPGLSTGGAYFVPDGPFREFLLGVTDQNEVSCFTFAQYIYVLTRVR
jgi:hypothetical protein